MEREGIIHMYTRDEYKPTSQFLILLHLYFMLFQPYNSRAKQTLIRVRRVDDVMGLGVELAHATPANTAIASLTGTICPVMRKEAVAMCKVLDSGEAPNMMYHNLWERISYSY